MAQYTAPGVYVEEISSGSAPIAGVSTSVAGFIGVVSDNVTMPPEPGKFKENEVDDEGYPIPILYEVAKAKEPQLITSWPEFKKKFGDFDPGNKILAHAVYGFFNNGGSRCWVVRSDSDNLDTGSVGKALERFEEIDEIGLVAVPGAVGKDIQDAVVTHCKNMGDRFAILDGKQKRLNSQEKITDAGTSNYAALYFPWIEVYDPVKAKEKKKKEEAKAAKEAQKETEATQNIADEKLIEAKRLAQEAEEAKTKAEQAQETETRAKQLAEQAEEAKTKAEQAQKTKTEAKQLAEQAQETRQAKQQAEEQAEEQAEKAQQKVDQANNAKDKTKANKKYKTANAKANTARAEAQIAQLKYENANAKAEAARVEAEIAQLKYENAKAEAEKAKAEAKNAEPEIAQLKYEVAKAQAENAKLKANKTKAQNTKTEAQELSDHDFVPPSGHIAGLYARVDAERGIHKAPANEVIRGALGLKYRISRNQQGELNREGINIIREFNGNVKVWGARTLGGDGNTEWKYISVRRLFIYLRQSIEEGTQWAVFEPNGPDLWAKIRRNITAFLTTVWRDGMLFGDTPEQAFFVRCDENTNPPELRDLGQVVTEIGVSVLKPAEFVIFRISQWNESGG